MITPTDESGATIELSDLAQGLNTAWLQSHAGYGEAQERIAELEAENERLKAINAHLEAEARDVVEECARWQLEALQLRDLLTGRDRVRAKK